MRRRPTTPAAGAFVALALALSLSACGGGAEAEGGQEGNTPSASGAASRTPDAAPRSEEKKAKASEPASGTGSVDAAVPPVEAGEEMPTEDLRAMLLAAVSGDGSAKMKGTQIADGTTSLTEGVYARVDGEVALDLTTVIEGAEGLESLETHTVLVDGALYSRTSGISGDSYLKTPVGEEGSVMDFSYLDPIAALDQHGDAVDSVVYAGEETHDGKKLTRYDVSVDPGRADTADSGAQAFTYSIFFNGKGRIARAEMKVGEDASTVTTYSDWGGRHRVVAPAASEVMELPGA